MKPRVLILQIEGTSDMTEKELKELGRRLDSDRFKVQQVSVNVIQSTKKKG